jgi:predicted ATPase
LLNLVIEQIPTASVLVLLTCRPYFQPAWHHRSYLTEITVNRLSHAQVEQIVTCVTDGKTLPTEVSHQIIAMTDGVPLFVEEMTKAILESGHLNEVDGHYALTGSFSTLAIPATLQDSLMARLDRLMTGKVIAQLGATIGRQFSYELLRAIAQLSDRTLHEELSRLVKAEIVYQRGMPPHSTYVFKHALIQDAAAQSLLKSTRQQYHQRIAQALETQFPETVETQPELVAHHYTEAGFTEQAVGYWQRAAQHARTRAAFVEAIADLTKGLELLKLLPDTPARARQELDLQIALGAALSVTKGPTARDVERVYVRARALCQAVGDTPQLFGVLQGLHVLYNSQGEFQRSRELAEQLLSLAQRLQDPALCLAAHRALGELWFQLGEFTPALAHCEQGIALAQQYGALALGYGGGLGVDCLRFSARVLWQLGYPDQALQRSHEALVLARTFAHPIVWLRPSARWPMSITSAGRHPRARSGLRRRSLWRRNKVFGTG